MVLGLSHSSGLMSQRLLVLALTLAVMLCTFWPRLCDCLSPGATISNQTIAFEAASAEDLCYECGHSKSCCFTNTQYAGGLLTNIDTLSSVISAVIVAAISFIAVALIASYAIRESTYARIPLSFSKWPCQKSYLAKQSLLI